jgi:hypothetical protein
VVLGFASFSFSSMMPPDGPALPVGAFCVATFRDLACFGAVLVVAFGPGEDDLDAMILVSYENVTGVDIVRQLYQLPVVPQK